MAILCCCPQLLNKRRHKIEEVATQDDGLQELPTRPPPARLPPSLPNGLTLSPQSTAARSSLTNPLPSAEADASVHLAELIMEDSEDDIGDDELLHTNKNRSTSTLDAVKARIRRHLSLDSIPGQSESEEQIARRAEVKRLMRKRIQEELQSENSPGLGGPSTLQHPAPSSVASVTILGSGPRDTIEFTVDEATKDKEAARFRPADMSDSLESGVQDNLTTACRRSSTHSKGKENGVVESRPVSLRDWIEHDLDATQSGHHKHFRKRSSLPEIPVSPQLQPVRAASLRDTASLASWRLSLTADRLADLLTPDKTRSLFRPVVTPADSYDAFQARSDDENYPRHDRTTSSPIAIKNAETADKVTASRVSLHSNHRGRCIPKSSSLVRDESPVGLWLRAQSQQFRLSTASPRHSELIFDDETQCPVRGSTAHQAREADTIHTQLEYTNSSRCSHSAAWEQRAASAALLSDAKHMKAFPQAISGIAPDGVPLTSISREICQTPTLVDAGGPLQNVVRRGLAGIRLPSFRCELTCWLRASRGANSKQGIICPANHRKNRSPIHPRSLAPAPLLRVWCFPTQGGRHWTQFPRLLALFVEKLSFVRWKSVFGTLTSETNPLFSLGAGSTKSLVIVPTSQQETRCCPNWSWICQWISGFSFINSMAMVRITIWHLL